MGWSIAMRCDLGQWFQLQLRSGTIQRSLVLLSYERWVGRAAFLSPDRGFPLSWLCL